MRSARRTAQAARASARYFASNGKGSTKAPEEPVFVSAKQARAQHNPGTSAGKLKGTQPVPPPNGPAQPPPAVGGPPTPLFNSWILHPSLPVGVRLLAIGVAGSALLAYQLYDATQTEPVKEKQEPTERELEVEEGVGQSGDATQEQQENNTPQPGPETPAHPELEEPTREAERAAEVSSESGAVPDSEPESVPKTEEENAGEEVEAVEGSEAVQLMQDVLSKDANQMLDEAAAVLAAEMEQRAEVTAGVKEGEEKARGLASQVAKENEDSKPPSRSSTKASGRERTVAEHLSALHGAISDTVAEHVSSDVGKGGGATGVTTTARPRAPLMRPPAPQEVPQEENETPTLSPATAAAAAALAGVSESACAVLGLRTDLTPAGLLAAAARRGHGSGDDWEDFKGRHRQAVEDAHTLAQVLESAAQHVQGELAELQAGVTAQRRALSEADAAAKRAVDEATARAEKRLEQELRIQDEALRLSHEAHLVEERKARLSSIDEVRQRLGALESAFQRRSAERRSSTSTHALTLGTLRLQSVLDAGGQPGDALATLKGAATEDTLVSAALGGSGSAKQQQVLTREALAQRLHDVESETRALGLLPAAGWGPVSLLVAKTVSFLKVSERGAPQSTVTEKPTLEQALAHAGDALATGDLAAAAAALEKAGQDTAAAPLLTTWASEARRRAELEQLSRLLTAHAGAVAASLV